MTALRTLLTRSIALAGAAMLGGCIVPGLQSFVVRPSANVVSVSLRTSATHAPCEITARSGSHLRHDCDYVIGGRTKLARVFLQDTATVEPLVDPVILQVPAQASGFGAIFSHGLVNGTLSVTEVVGDLYADLTRIIVPEAGYKLLIVDFPAPTPPLDGRNYTFGLVFPVTGVSTPIRLKALFAAKVAHGGRTFYPPLFPCATTFASIPAVSLQENGAYVDVDLSAVLAANACSGSFYTFSPISPETVDVIEYYHEGFDHYFVTWLPAEIAILDAGTAIRGWVRTGREFKAFATAQAGSSPVCRFYIPPANGDSHFYGRGAAECDATATSLPQLVLEAREFMYVALPDNGVCPDGMTSIYRVFSGRADANHRYMADRSLRDAMVARGWIAEGDGPDRIVMCTPF